MSKKKPKVKEFLFTLEECDVWQRQSQEDKRRFLEAQLHEVFYPLDNPSVFYMLTGFRIGNSFSGYVSFEFFCLNSQQKLETSYQIKAGLPEMKENWVYYHGYLHFQSTSLWEMRNIQFLKKPLSNDEE